MVEARMSLLDALLHRQARRSTLTHGRSLLGRQTHWTLEEKMHDEPTFDPIAVEPDDDERDQAEEEFNARLLANPDDDDAAKAFKAIEGVAAAGGSVREMEAAAHDALMGRTHEVYERDHRATVAKLRTLAADADKRSNEGDGYASQYWRGYREGLLRSITTIEGRDHSPS